MLIKYKLKNSKCLLIVSLLFYYRRIKSLFKYFFAKSHLEEFVSLKGKRKCLVLLAADYGNLGDVAIAYSQARYLSAHFPGYEIVYLPYRKTFSHLRSLKKVCNHDDIITLTGGGFMGDLYMGAEILRQLIFTVFKNYKIISFPQTAFFTQTVSGQFFLKQAIRIYSQCPNLELWARDKISYNLLKNAFINNKVSFTPDIVMTLDCYDDTTIRKGITLCLRNDNEKKPETDIIVDKLIDKITNRGIDISYHDTHLGSVCLDIIQGHRELDKILYHFKSSELVITDRLHGMIFAFITGTPAIVLVNNYYKLSECYKWIKDCGYIHLVTNYDDAESFLFKSHTNIKQGFQSTHNFIMEKFNEIVPFK